MYVKPVVISFFNVVVLSASIQAAEPESGANGTVLAQFQKEAPVEVRNEKDGKPVETVEGGYIRGRPFTWGNRTAYPPIRY